MREISQASVRVIHKMLFEQVFNASMECAWEDFHNEKPLEPRKAVSGDSYRSQREEWLEVRAAAYVKQLMKETGK